MVDVLVLSLGTTRGWRVADATLVDMLREAGVSAVGAGVRIGAADALRRGYPLNDLVEAYAARRALATALARERPRAVIFGSTTPALLARPGLPYAVWLDSPAALNRPGARNFAVHRWERASLGRARVVMPMSAEAIPALPAAESVAVLPPPVALPPAVAEARERLVVAYTPDPWAKGLELVVRAWGSLASRRNARLVICGIEPGWAREFLRRRGISELPPGLELAGMVPREQFLALLGRARVYLSGAEWEDFGMTPLEALAAGAALCLAPAGGPFPALAWTRRVAPRFVAAERSPEALAGALAAALEARDLDAYRAAARAELELYSRAAGVRTLRERVLPSLLR